MAKQIWKIRGSDGDKPFFEADIAAGAMSEKEMTTLLQRLVSRHLTGEEVVSGSLRSNAKGYLPCLEVRPNRGGTPGLWTTGSGHHYIAIIVDVQ